MIISFLRQRGSLDLDPFRLVHEKFYIFWNPSEGSTSIIVDVYELTLLQVLITVGPYINYTLLNYLCKNRLLVCMLDIKIKLNINDAIKYIL